LTESGEMLSKDSYNRFVAIMLKHVMVKFMINHGERCENRYA